MEPSAVCDCDVRGPDVSTVMRDGRGGPQAHTPGPWEVIDGVNIWTGLGARIAHGLKCDDKEGWLIASMGDLDSSIAGEHASMPYAEKKANARLIGAAPDLFAVVKDFRRKLATYVGVYPGDKELVRLLADCEAAIEKATGDSRHDCK